jgi:hypothetical protein
MTRARAGHSFDAWNRAQDRALRDALSAFPRPRRRALPIAIQLAGRDQQNFDQTLALIAALKRRPLTQAEKDEQRSTREDTLAKRYA